MRHVLPLLALTSTFGCFNPPDIKLELANDETEGDTETAGTDETEGTEGGDGQDTAPTGGQDPTTDGGESSSGGSQGEDGDETGADDDGTTGGDDSFYVELGDKKCLTADDELVDFVVGGYGGWSCSLEVGNGAGQIPNGMTYNETTCALEGSIDEDLNGSWAFIVKVERDDGEKAYVPYCAGQRNTWSDIYDIVVDHSGITDVEGQPAVVTFAPSAELVAQDVVDVEFIGESECDGGGCEHGMIITPSMSPFDDDVGAEPDVVGPVPGGYRYRISLDGPDVPIDFAHRPFVVSMHVKLCVEAEQDFCNGQSAIDFHGQGSIQVSVIMQPE